MRLRQIVLVAEDLRPVERAILETLGLEVCYRDPGLATFGLRHGLYPIGDQLLEVVAPRTEDTTAGRFLTRRGGDGGYMVIVQVDDLQAERDRLATTDIRIVHEAQSHLGGHKVAGLHLHPRDVGGAILSIDAADPAETWAWAGTDWDFHSRTDVVSAVTAVNFRSPDPNAMARRWANALGQSVQDADADGPARVTLADAEIRFLPSTDHADDSGAGADVLVGFDLRASDRARVGEIHTLGGADFTFV